MADTPSYVEADPGSGGNKLAITQVTSGADTIDVHWGTIAQWDGTSAFDLVDSGAPLHVQIGDGSNQATIRNLSNSNGVNVAIIDGNGDQMTTIGGGTQYAADDALGSTPTGTLGIAQRVDTPATVTPAAGDAVPLQVDSEGSLWVHLNAGDGIVGQVKLTDGTNTPNVSSLSNSDALHVLLVDSSGDQITSFGGGTQYAVDTALGSTPTGTLGITERSDTLSVLTPVDGDAVPMYSNDRGALWVALIDSSGTQVDSLGVTQYAVNDALGSTPTGTLGLSVYDGTLGSVAYSDGDAAPIRTDSYGAMWITVTDGSGTAISSFGGGGTEYTEGDTDASITGVAFLWEDSADTLRAVSSAKPLPVSEASASTIATNTGTTATNTGTIATNTGTTATNTGTIASDTSTISTNSSTIASNTGTTASNTTSISSDASTIATNTTTLAGTVGSGNINTSLQTAIPAGTAEIGKVRITDGSNELGTTSSNSAKTILNPETSGGVSVYHTNDLDETEEEIKSSAGQVYGYFLHNASAGTMFFQFYNATAASVTVGTTTPLFTLPVPTGASANIAIPHGVAFSTALSIAATTTYGGADAPGANEAFATIWYK